jgi:hypothetical protein
VPLEEIPLSNWVVFHFEEWFSNLGLFYSSCQVHLSKTVFVFFFLVELGVWTEGSTTWAPPLTHFLFLWIGCCVSALAGRHYDPPICTSLVAGITRHVPPHPAYWLRWGIGNFLPRLASNHHLPDLYLLSSWGYRCVPQHQARFCSLVTEFLHSQFS